MARTVGQYVERDSTGVDRILWGQEWGSTCGPASCYMVCCSVKQSTLGGGEAFMRTLAMKYGTSLFDMMTGGPGTTMQVLKRILQDNGMRIDAKHYAEAEFMPMIIAASETKPVIFHVAWYQRNNELKWVGGGGHWIVSVGTIGSSALFLDPWYGLREIPLMSLPTYNPASPNQSLDPAQASSWGLLSGWLLRVM